MPEQTILGRSPKDWVNLLHSDEAKEAQRALNFLDGKQYDEMVKVLNDPHKGRAKWKEKGIIPRWRNITRAIVEKSALLFSHKPPTFDVYDNDLDQNTSEIITNLLYKADYQEVFSNLDIVVRLLKTAMLLTQYDSETEAFSFDILHRANSAVVRDGTKIAGLIYKTSDDSGVKTYRIFTQEEVYDLEEEQGQIQVSAPELNSYNTIPVTVFYDTYTPRASFWNQPGNDLINLNEMVNLHITDSEYSISWNKLPTLITNIPPSAVNTAKVDIEIGSTYDNPQPRVLSEDPVVLGGPSSMIYMDSRGIENPFIKYETPTVDLRPLDEIVDSWVRGFASDWSVRLKTAGSGSASSGFQLIVEEMDNLELRQLRQRQFENGFKRWFRIAKAVLSTQGINIPEEKELYVTFSQPELPFDRKESEEIWTLKIQEGRASVIDYLMENEGLTREEALSRIAQIAEDNKLVKSISIDIPTGNSTE